MISALLTALLLLSPSSLPAGPHPSGPHVDGRVLHDGSMRMTFSAPRVTFLGMAGDRYVMHLSRADGSHSRVMWIRPDETSRVLWRGLSPFEVVVSRDGRTVLTTPFESRGSTTVRVLAASSGRVLVTRTFRGSVSVLDAASGRAVLGGWSPNRTFWWTYGGTDDTSLINHRVGYAASIPADRVASYTQDPYNGGCSVLSTLSSSRLSRSCRERVAAISPSGASVATIPLLSDGLGPSSVSVRRAAGRLLSTYDAPYYFGTIRFENSSALLMDTYGQRRWAVVRCDGDDCERASKLRATPDI